MSFKANEAGAGTEIAADSIPDPVTGNAADRQVTRDQSLAGDFADGAISTLGLKADAAWNGAASSATVVALLKALYRKGTAVNTQVTVGTSAVTLLALNASRIRATFVNMDPSNWVYIAHVNTVTATGATAGTPLAPNGGAFEDVATAGVWYAVSTGAAADVRVMEIS